MFWRILKKDLKRKKAMNIILLLFVALAAMFVASSVNNIITVMNGLDHYFEEAHLDCDYIVMAMDRETDFDALFSEADCVRDFRSEPVYVTSLTSVKKDGKKAIEKRSFMMVQPIGGSAIRYFDSDNQKLTAVREGEFYISGSILKQYNLKIGEQYEISLGDKQMKLTLCGGCKDALFGSDFMSAARVLLNDTDFQRIAEDNPAAENMQGSVNYIYSDDTSAVKGMLGEAKGVLFDAPIATIRTSYVMSMVIAAVLIIVSVCLILISFIVLRFTIGFTLTEEFREIGVMKAIGLRSSRIRLLYIVKYFGISVIGALIGFGFSIPFERLLLKSASDTMVLGSRHGILTALLCAFAVVAVIMLFCYSCTARIRKMSPIDAVRSGQTGERFRKKRGMRIGKSPLRPTGYLAVNDVLSSPKQFSIIAVVLALCLSLTMILATCANTLEGDSLFYLFGHNRADVYFTAEKMNSVLLSGDFPDEEYEKEMKEIENMLAEHDMPAKVMTELMYKYKFTSGDVSVMLTCQKGFHTQMSEYTCEEGSLPQNANEIMVTPQVAEMLKAGIGDTVQIEMNGETDDYIISGKFTTMNQLGEIVRLHNDAPTHYRDSIGCFYTQATFTDHPDQAEISRRMERIGEIFDTNEVFDTAGFVRDCTMVADTLRAVEYLLLIITMIVTALITVLMERSFISKETSEIALMKAIGIRSRRIIGQHTLRFVITAGAAVVLSAVFCIPLTRLSLTPIFGIMGATGYSLSYTYRPLELFVILPAVLLLVTALSAGATALYTKTVRASQTADIE